MLKPVPEIRSHGQEYLITLIKERNLRSWCDEHGVAHAYAYKIALGERDPSYTFIFACRFLIQPCSWVYTLDEKLPAFMNMTRPKVIEPTFTKPSLGLIELQKITGLTQWCKDHALPYQIVYYLSTGRSRPNVRNISILKNTIHPDSWFIYP